MKKFFITKSIIVLILIILPFISSLVFVNSSEASTDPRINTKSNLHNSSVVVNVTVDYSAIDDTNLMSSITQLIEINLADTENIMSIRSASNQHNHVNTVVQFTRETDPYFAQICVQKKIEKIKFRLPESIKNSLLVERGNTNLLTAIDFYPENSSLAIAELLTSSVIDPMRRIEGVARVNVVRAPIYIQLYLNPDKLAHYKLSIKDILEAIHTFDNSYKIEQLKSDLIADEILLNITVPADGYWTKTDWWLSMICLEKNCSSKSIGSRLSLKDVAKIKEITSDNHFIYRYNGQSAIGLIVYVETDADKQKVLASITKIIKQVTVDKHIKYAFSDDNIF